MRFFHGQSNQGFGRQKDIPMLLKEIQRFSGIKMGAVDLFLVGRRVGPGDEFDGLDSHGSGHPLGTWMDLFTAENLGNFTRNNQGLNDFFKVIYR